MWSHLCWPGHLSAHHPLTVTHPHRPPDRYTAATQPPGKLHPETQEAAGPASAPWLLCGPCRPLVTGATPMGKQTQLEARLEGRQGAGVPTSTTAAAGPTKAYSSPPSRESQQLGEGGRLVSGQTQPHPGTGWAPSASRRAGAKPRRGRSKRGHCAGLILWLRNSREPPGGGQVKFTGGIGPEHGVPEALMVPLPRLFPRPRLPTSPRRPSPISRADPFSWHHAKMLGWVPGLEFFLPAQPRQARGLSIGPPAHGRT